jgi:EAL domain-containing protein (putative c-di-GMP-specific phosphodiesterase class I)/DNA-binding response OmpR family regulator
MTERGVDGARVFIVDDEELNVRFLERALAHSGLVNVRSFHDGRAMLDALAADRPDLVLLDLHLPGLDGYAVLEALRAEQDEDEFLPVLILTADAERRARSRALSGGANDFLLKPFDIEEVVLRVRNLVRTRILQQALSARNAALVGDVKTSRRELETTEARWAAIAASLGRLETLSTPEATAEAICAELDGTGDLQAVAIMGFGAGESTVPLAIRSATEARLGVNRSLPATWSHWLRTRLVDGPWFGPTTDLGVDGRAPSPLGPDLTALALFPLHTGGTPLGVLAAATAGPDGVSRLARGLPALEAYAALASALLAPGIVARQRDGMVRAEIEAVIAGSAYQPVFQPIVDLRSNRAVGFEALTRFSDGSRPDRRFDEAAAVGLGLELETASLSAALMAAPSLPADAWLSLNVSPELVTADGLLVDLLARTSRPIVLEITEHVPIADYDAFRTAIRALGTNIRSSIDDAGAGYSSFRHIVELAPDFVKLDIGLVRAIERDPARQALVAGMVYFALKTGCSLIAEGIETTGERATLEALEVDLGQGYLLGRPVPVLTLKAAG